MTIIGQGNLNPADWIGVLEQVVDPLIKNHEKPHQYIVQEDDHLALSTSREHKLTLKEIVDISARAISTLENERRVGKIETFDAFPKIVDIIRLTEEIIDARVLKRSSNYRRQTARKIASIASLFLIGLPFFAALKLGDNKFYSEIKELKKHLSDARDGIVISFEVADPPTTQTTPQVPPPQIQP